MEIAEKKLSGWFVFWCVFGFFVTVGAVDGAFVYFATSTYSGTVTEQPYEMGLAYNQTIEVAKKQDALKIESHGGYDANGNFFVSLKDEQGKPINGAKVQAHMMRPVDEEHDFDLVLKQQGDGLYTAKLNQPVKGLWIARTEASWDTETYRSAYKFMVK